MNIERLNSFIWAEAAKCVGCRTCEIACALAHMPVTPAGAEEVKTRAADTDVWAQFWHLTHDTNSKAVTLTPRLHVVAAGDVTVPVMCRHCEDAPCANVCSMSAISRTDGRITVNTERCVGCRLCLMACPIGAIELTQSNPDAETIFSKDANPNLKTSYRASKCDLCYDQPDGPACVKHCPEKALVKMSAEGSAKSRRTEAVLAQIAALGGINAVNLSESEEDVVSWTTGLPSMLTQLNGVNVSEEDVARWRSFAVENDTLPERALDRGFWTDSVQPARKAKNDDTQR